MFLLSWMFFYLYKRLASDFSNLFVLNSNLNHVFAFDKLEIVLNTFSLDKKDYTMKEFCEALPTNIAIQFTYNYELGCKITDAPGNFGVMCVNKGYNNNYLNAILYDYKGGIYKFKYGTNTETNGWYEYIAKYEGASAWKDLTLKSEFKLYDGNSVAKYRKIGKFVEIVGTVAPTSALAGSNGHDIAVLPSGYRPKYQVLVIQQGSGTNKWLMRVKENGIMLIERYGVSSNIDIPTTAWLPFYTMFAVD